MREQKEREIKKLLHLAEEELKVFLTNYDMKNNSYIDINIQYIQLSLKKISILNAASLYYYSNKKDIPSKYIDNIIDSIHSLCVFIIDKQKNKGKILSLSEIAVNFKVWQSDIKVLHSIIVKMYFLLKCLVSYFAIDKRWLIVTGDLCYLLPNVVVSFMDIKSYQQNDELNNLSLGTLKNTYRLLLTIFEWTAEECLKIYAINRKQRYWCFRGLNILYILSNFYILENQQVKRKIIQDRMEAIRKRMYIEQKSSNNVLEKNLSTMPLEDLLKMDSNYSKH